MGRGPLAERGDPGQRGSLALPGYPLPSRGNPHSASGTPDGRGGVPVTQSGRLPVSGQHRDRLILRVDQGCGRRHQVVVNPLGGARIVLTVGEAVLCVMLCPRVGLSGFMWGMKGVLVVIDRVNAWFQDLMPAWFTQYRALIVIIICWNLLVMLGL